MSWSTIPVFIILFGILVVVHEFGHFFFARLFGVTVYEFSVGLGPVLWQTKRHDILYSVRAIPFGGFAKVAGMEIVIEGKDEKKPGERLFSALSLGKKIMILVAGSLNNLVVAMLTFVFIAAALGLPYQLQSDRALVGFVEPKSPAYEAGLSTGDEIIALNGQKIKSWEEITRIIHNSPREKLTIKFKRKEAIFTREIIPVYDSALKAGRIGILPAYAVKRLPLWEAICYGVGVTGYQLVALPVSIFKIMIGQERAQFLGPIGMVGVIDQALKSGLYLFFTMFASFNLFLGIFNLLPIPLPLLDGGWIVIYILEKLRGKEFTPEQKASAQMIGLLLIVTFYLAVIFSDITSVLRRLLPKS